VAFATALCSGINPFTCSFKQTEMRSHLLTCFESRKLSAFTPPDRPRRLAHCRELSTKRVPVYCVCRLPWNKYDNKRAVPLSNVIHVSHGFINYAGTLIMISSSITQLNFFVILARLILKFIASYFIVNLCATLNY
jgi:hypothetical protein